MSKRILFILILLSASLMVMIAGKMWTLKTGELVLLETRPVDPRSLFRGDYVRIELGIGDLESEQLGGDDQFQKHDELFVVLRKAEPWWMPVSMHHAYPPIVAAGQVVVRGVIDDVMPVAIKDGVESVEYSVKYGIESYFVPENEGLAIERDMGKESISLEVAVDDRGNAAIHGLLVNGEPLYQEGFY